jgi:hypothetical protein
VLGVGVHHGEQFQLGGALPRHRHADHAARVLQEEVHLLRGHVGRCEDEVPFILARLIVDHDDHAPLADIRDGLLY